MQIEEDPASWQTLIIKYLQKGSLPETPKDSKKVSDILHNH